MGPGFIHDKLDLKLLILYIVGRVEEPIDFAALTDLTLPADDGVDYFTFAEAVGELVSSGHLTLENGLYTITDKGKANGGIMESSLPVVVRGRCDKALSAFNRHLRRQRQVVAEVSQDGAGRYQVRLYLADNDGALLDFTLLVYSQERANRLAERFKAAPEELYTRLLSTLTKEEA